jgi:hypothetical protein
VTIQVKSRPTTTCPSARSIKREGSEHKGLGRRLVVQRTTGKDTKRTEPHGMNAAISGGPKWVTLLTFLDVISTVLAVSIVVL